jgi:hypothetical protein
MKALLELYPTSKTDDLELLSTMMTKKEVDQLLRDHGNDD